MKQPFPAVTLRRVLASVWGALLLAGCASHPINPPIEQVDPTGGYRPSVLIPQIENNDLSTLFILSFSGGGTRAAALSYGVLKELRGVEFTTAAGQQRRLLDEVDLMSGVSGGSFTALAYALYGDQLFNEYEQRFLKRNVEGALAARTFLNPVNWVRLLSGSFGRSEIAEEYYDEILFNDATFSQLVDKHDVPVAVANGTDITTGSRLAFYQDEFDMLCSDLGAVELSRAAATSSAVPLVLSPVTFNNYGGHCGYQFPVWVKDIEKLDAAARPAGRSLERYKEMKTFTDSAEHPYIHMVDGGVSDNIGVRGVLEAFEEAFVSRAFSEERGFSKINKIVLIVVNAKSAHEKDWEQKKSPPGMIKQMMQSTGVPIERYSFETVELMKDRAEVAQWRRELAIAQAQLAGLTRAEAEAKYPNVEFYVVDINFDNISDPVRREYFENLPTSFSLKEEQVDNLIEIGGELMRQSPVYQQVLSELDRSTKP